MGRAKEIGSLVIGIIPEGSRFDKISKALENGTKVSFIDLVDDVSEFSQRDNSS